MKGEVYNIKYLGVHKTGLIKKAILEVNGKKSYIFEKDTYTILTDEKGN